MKTEKIKNIAQFISLFILLAVGYFWLSDDAEMQKLFYRLAVGLGLAIGVGIIVWIITNYRLLWYFIRTHLPWTFFHPIRITVAYLFRIEVDGKYLLIRNSRNILGFQPVGGVYKYLRRENAAFFDSIGLIPDASIQRDIIAEDDLRMQMKKRYKLLSFIRWFTKKEHREIDPWREFYEELIRPGIFSHRNFPHIQYRYVKQHSELKYSKHHKITEYKVADIYELQISTEAQKEEIRQLIKQGHKDVIFATADEIKRRKQGEYQITEHAYKIV